jgi:hypothetical protein
VLNQISLFTIKLTSNPVRIRLALFALCVLLLTMAVLIPGMHPLADGIPGGPRPTP